jgi:hypothetical protein
VLREWVTGDRRALVGRVGRRGGKSSSLCRWAVAEVIAGEHVVPDADLGVLAVVSVERRDAVERIRTCGVLLTLAGWREVRATGGAVKRGEFVQRLGAGNTELLVGTEYGVRAIRVLTASVKGVSGFTSIGILGDEMAKWRDDDTDTNPAQEVVQSILPTLATQPLAKVAWISSPWSTLDVHHRMVDAGDTPGQMVRIAPTWAANPTITEAQTRSWETDPLVWEREYAAIPMPAVTSVFFDPKAVDECMAAE